MPGYTDNLRLILPRGSKYWNLDTWNENMKILDRAYIDVQHSIQTQLVASNVSFDNSLTPVIESTTVQGAIPEVLAKKDFIIYRNITSDTTFTVPIEHHAYFVLTFGSSVPRVNFIKSDETSPVNFQWLNGEPEFEADSTFELSFLNLACIWAKRNEFDFDRYFEWYEQNDTIYITKIKTVVWYEDFGHYNFKVPAYAHGKPVMIDDR